MRNARRLAALEAAGILALLALWAAASAVGGKYLVPAPWTTVGDAAVLLSSAANRRQIALTLARVASGFAAGFAAGTVAGILIGLSREADALLKPLVLFFQGMPPILWVFPIVLAIGIGSLPTILVIALICFPVVAVTVGEGMGSLPREYREMLAVFAPGFRPRLKELILPHLKPFLAASLNVGLVLAVKASVTAEYFGANDGIGFRIQAAYQSFQIRTLFAWAFLLVLIILLFHRALPRLRRIGPAARRLLRRKRREACSLEDIRELKTLFLTQRTPARIRMQGVSFAYRGRERVLSGIDLTVERDGIAVITGDSGTGKTTLLKLVASLLKPSEGRIERPDNIGFVFQDDRLLPWRTAAENAALPLLYGGQPRRHALCFAGYLLSEAGLAGEGDRKPEELSGGMKKRVALARCFARIPDAILLDEPFSGLHREAREELWAQLLALLELHTVPVIVVTHFPEEVAPQARCTVYGLSGRPATLRRREG
jgi:ABC-type nitrate/sulfonate/bicarbonate transport system ATPase subunit/ABC-type nitrate/sulfonate/bicarbonate transport system permease component